MLSWWHRPLALSRPPKASKAFWNRSLWWLPGPWWCLGRRALAGWPPWRAWEFPAVSPPGPECSMRFHYLWSCLHHILPWFGRLRAPGWRLQWPEVVEKTSSDHGSLEPNHYEHPSLSIPSRCKRNSPQKATHDNKTSPTARTKWISRSLWATQRGNVFTKSACSVIPLISRAQKELTWMNLCMNPTCVCLPMCSER